MKLFSKYFDLYVINRTSMIQTDGRTTDGQTTCHDITAYCVASRGEA